jgi:hypothetical protein
MAEESAVAAQIVHLLRHHPPGVWELVEARETARAGDIVLRDANGAPVAYARSAASCTTHRCPRG